MTETLTPFQRRQRAEATNNVVFLLQVRSSKREAWRTESVWLTREEATDFAERHAYRWRHWQVYGTPSSGMLPEIIAESGR